jgi:hypothetical protein
VWTGVDYCLIEIRRAWALPIYTVALILSFTWDVLGIIAAKIAGDDWPG